MSILSFFRKSAPAPRLPKDDDAMMRLYKKLRWQSFIAGTVGYSLYYVCRTSLNVVKKPILESGALDATQLGVIGSALLFAYAIGKFVNGFLSDHSNIKRFMAAGLAVSAVANLLVGILGFTMACVFATFYAVATKSAPGRSNEVAGLMILAISAGALSGPICGALIRSFGHPQAGLIWVTACVCYLLWAATVLKSDTKK